MNMGFPPASDRVAWFVMSASINWLGLQRRPPSVVEALTGAHEQDRCVSTSTSAAAIRLNDLGIAPDHRAREALLAELEPDSGADDTTREVIIKADVTPRTVLGPRSTGRVAQFVEALVVCAAVLYFAVGGIAILVG